MEKRHPNHPGEMGTDAALAERERTSDELNARARAVGLLREAGVPFVVGGAYAYATYTGIYRDTKDLDLFPRKADAARALEVLEKDGWRTERTDEVWLYKAFKGEYFVDFIFSSGNGVAEVDDGWFEHARTSTIFGHECLVAPAEEMIWSKAFVAERERFDGADVNHLILKAGKQMDWERLMRRFDRYWEVLLSHLMMFRFAYPSERDLIPDWVMAELMRRTLDSMRDGGWEQKLCRGNLVSKVNYHVDIHHWGFGDGRAWDENERRLGGERGEGSELEGSIGGGR
ncbi:nucleotidyltransferase [Myxococcus faecalis]|uniref:nucleotidyltransferase n=2 Tax=Myxococcaceae TaxID=31 RepID=UPI0038F99347|nr:nucleotidyltransferase family protein [Myxococcus fulvus]